MPNDNQNKGEIIVYQSKDGLTRVDVRFEGDSVWLTQAQLVELYHSSKSNISEHIRHIFEDGELNSDSVVRKFRTTAADGKAYQVMYYNELQSRQKPPSLLRGRCVFALDYLLYFSRF